MNWFQFSELNFDNLFDTVMSALKCELLYQGDIDSFDEDIHKPAQRLIRDVMFAFGNTSIALIHPFLQVFQDFTSSEEVEYQELGLQFYGDFVLTMNDDNLTPLEMKSFLLEKSLSMPQSPISYGVIKNLAKVSPDIFDNVKNQLLSNIYEILSSDQIKSNEFQSLQDCCVSALYSIATNILKESFPIHQFLEITLKAMPAQMDVEENPDILQFYEYLFQQTNGEPPLSFFGVLFRIFSDPFDDLHIDSETAKKMLRYLQLLMVKMGNFSNYLYELSQGDEFKIHEFSQAVQYSQNF